METIDYIIDNALIVDGTRAPPGRAVVGITRDGRLRIPVPNTVDGTAHRIDATGFVAAPGFVDIHTHTDMAQFIDPFVSNRAYDGVTLEVGGNCGVSPFPLSDKTARELRSLSAPVGITIDWHDFRTYRSAIARCGTVLNRTYFVGHGALRSFVLDDDLLPASRADVDEMAAFLETELAAGACGLSLGLGTAPGCAATTGELEALCTVVASHDKLVSVHLRNEGVHVAAAVDEVVELAERTGVAMHIAHLKVVGSENWHRLPSLLTRLRNARARGIRVTADRYPYATAHLSLDALLPGHTPMTPRSELCRNLDGPTFRKALARSLGTHALDWSHVTLAGLSLPNEFSSCVGRTIIDGARYQGLDVATFIIDLLRTSRCRAAVHWTAMGEENLAAILKEPYVMVASDASGLPEGIAMPGDFPHPRAYGTFSHVLGHFVRDTGLLTVEDAIHRMTLLPARTVGIEKRGALLDGWYADLVLYDPTRIKSRSTLTSPQALAEGICWSFVNGCPVITDGVLTRRHLPGRVLGAVDEGRQFNHA